jgi:ketosteroid isomerase-like protein
MKLALALLAALGVASAASPGESAVRAALDQFNKAAAAGDEATLNKLIGDELMYSHSNAKVETKAECVAALVKSKPNFVLDGEPSIHVYGQAASVHGKMTAHIVQNGAPTKIPLHFLMVWNRKGGAWVMVARHTTRLAP